MRVFVCTTDDGRGEFLFRALRAWGRDCMVITPQLLAVTAREFQRKRRIYADGWSRGGDDVYVLADDDCLPVSEDVLERGVEILRRHPEYTILSLWPENESIVEWTPEGYQTANDAEVMEHVSVGGVRFCRKMPFAVWPEMPEGEYRGYDGVQCEAIRKAGKRVGYFRDLKMVHLGKGQTTLL